jgi:hypothetical protein
MRARRHAANGSSSRSRPTGELDIFADPIESPPKKMDPRRVRRNSESSIMSGKFLDPEDEKRRQEKRRRERRAHREATKDGRSKKPDRKLDLIDKLDVTSIYGTGCKYFETYSRSIANFNSIPSRWTIRCLQPSPKPTRKQTRSNASISKGFSQ